MNILRQITEKVIVFLFMALVAVVFYQVIARYVFNNPPSWTEELARYCQVWIVLLTSSICIRRGSHLAVDYLSHRLSEKMNQRVAIVNHVLMVLYICAVIGFGWKLMSVGRYQVSPALRINMLFVYIIFPISGLLMLFEAVLKTAALFNRKPAHPLEEHK